MIMCWQEHLFGFFHYILCKALMNVLANPIHATGCENIFAQYVWLLYWADSLEKNLMLGKNEGKRGRGWQRWDGSITSPNQWKWIWANSRRLWRTSGAWRAAVHGVTNSWTWLNDWTVTLFHITYKWLLELISIKFIMPVTKDQNVDRLENALQKREWMNNQ